MNPSAGKLLRLRDAEKLFRLCFERYAERGVFAHLFREGVHAIKGDGAEDFRETMQGADVHDALAGLNLFVEKVPGADTRGTETTPLRTV